MNPRLWFAGTPEFAAYSLKALIDSPDYQIDGVLTQPDRPAGRGRKLTASAVKNVALEHNIPVAQPEKLLATEPPFSDLPRPDLVIVAAYGLLLPEWFLNYPRLGCLNIHASLLPRWRGAAPIQRAILAGDKETGIGIMQMDKGLDTGAVWLEKHLPIWESENAGKLHDRLMKLGAEGLLETLPRVLAGKDKPTPQPDHGATYAHKLTKAEAQIHWQESAAEIARKIRAFNPFPIAFALLEGQNVRFHEAEAMEWTEKEKLPAAGTVIQHDLNGIFIATTDGVLRVLEIQLAGKKTTRAANLCTGRNLTGKQFS